jgi:exportin-7
MDQGQLLQVEKLCQDLYEGTNQAQRAEAQQQLLTLQSTADFIPQCQFILDNSSQAYAQLIAASSLEHLVSQFWNSFTIPQRVELKSYAIMYLGNNAQRLEDFVVNQLTKLCGRLVKLGWFDSPEFREISDDVTKFLEASEHHHIIGMRILVSLVDEMNTQTPGRTLTVHRKTAMSFRDQILLQIFEISVASLRNLQISIQRMRTETELKLITVCLQLSNQCLAFDFIGTNPEESSEDVGTVQVPSSWRTIVQDISTMQLFFDYYNFTEPPRSNAALEVLVNLASVRRSLFTSDKERSIFLQTLMSGVQAIMQSKKGLEHMPNYHEFCRMLGRLKASYQLSELVKINGFAEWMELASDFTIKSLANWQFSMNSIHYLLALWGRLVAALPYLRTDSPDAQRQAQVLRQCTLQVVEQYIKTMLDSVDVVLANDGTIDDPLEDESSLREQMDRLPVIARLQYETVAQYLAQAFEESLSMYQQCASMSSNGQVAHQMKILEGRMTWLTYFVASVIDAQASADSRKVQSDLVWDGRLSRCVFQLIQLIDYRLTSSNGRFKSDEKLEVSRLYFFKAFKKVYLVENGTSTSTPSLSSISIPGGGAVHPMLSSILSSIKPDEKDGSGDVLQIYDAMGLGDIIAVMNILVNKLCNNIKYWHREDRILEETLEVFIELISSYNSSKTLLNLETVQFLIHNHVGAHFPFLGYDNDNKYRIKFYSALSRLVFSSSEDLNNAFDVFMVPNLQILQELSQTPDLRNQAAKVAIVAALRDLRGIIVSAYNKRTYGLLFEALYPTYFPFFRCVAETWYDDPVVMTALMKFLQEFVANKGQRIYFENSSANGILLFRETSAIVCTYGSQILQVPLKVSIYLEKYKGIRLMLNTMTNALSGNYVNFGVFALYNDSALQNALDVCLQICLQIPLSDVMAYVKLSRAYFAFLEVLFRNHLDTLSALDSVVFLQLLKTCQEGLQSAELTVATNCSCVIDHVATYMFLNQSRDKPTAQMIRSHIASNPDLLNQLMSTLFNALIFGNQANHWAMTRPILSLLLASEGSYNEYQAHLIATQPPENHDKLREEFAKLTADIQRSVEVNNRDKFTQKLSMFRLNLRSFLSL